MANRKSEALALAIKNGDTVYETGKPCKRGHISPRLVSTHVCIQCNKEIHYIKDRENYRYKDTLYRQFCARKFAATNKGIPFTIKFEEIEQPKYCPVLGLELVYQWSGTGRRDPAKACIDKLIPELGYVPGNVFVISWRANFLKSNATLYELESIIKYLKDKSNG